MSMFAPPPATPAEQRFDIVSKSNVALDPNGHLLHIENVTKVYKGKDGPKTVLDNVDLRVSKGEFVSLVGPSGCGKSTLLRLIVGQEEPTTGGLFLQGTPINFPDPSRVIVYQKYPLFPHLNVIDNLLFAPRRSLSFAEFRKREPEIRDRAMEYLKIAHLEDSTSKYPKELSGGQQQRTAVLRALMVDRMQVLMMDEPFGALDGGTRERMQTFLLQLWEKMEMTIFFVTHDLEEAVFLGTRVVTLSQFYTDDRKDVQIRGSRVTCDIPTGIVGQAQSTKSKLDPKFTHTIEHIRDMMGNPNHLYHVNEFDLSHPDSFHTVSPEELKSPS